MNIIFNLFFDIDIHSQKELRQKKEDAFCPLEKFVLLGVRTFIQGVSMAVLQDYLGEYDIAVGNEFVGVQLAQFFIVYFNHYMA